MKKNHPNIYPVILAGSVDTALWPASREAFPKQMLPFLSNLTMLQEAILRVLSVPGVIAPVVVCDIEFRFLVAEQIRTINASNVTILVAQSNRNTAPAAAAAARLIVADDPDAVLLLLPAGHAITKPEAFHSAVEGAYAEVENGSLVAFGAYVSGSFSSANIAPDGLDVKNSVGRYSDQKKNMHSALSADIDFAETGMYLFRAGHYLAELKRHAPEIALAAEASVNLGRRDVDFFRLDEKSFGMSPAQSIDTALMVRSEAAIIMPLDAGWSDVASWAALWHVQNKDERGNTVCGDVYIDGVSNSLIRAERRIVAVIGVSDLIVVETEDAVLIAHKDQSHRVDKVVAHLGAKNRTEHLHHTKVYRPWGCYEGIDIGERFQVKRITVKPGQKLSLQMHHHRAEHWVVVSGTARVTCGDHVTLLSENQSTYIPIGVNHRLENPGKVPLHIIEVQSGSYLGEDDIVRFDDIYKRT
ncbi:MAG: mannose-1-phosphate guanylyltransferase/mannose-6-phosphate isomerase [Telluria sp.]